MEIVLKLLKEDKLLSEIAAKGNINPNQLRSWIKEFLENASRAFSWIDNVIIERWFRSLKCDNIYLNDYQSPRELHAGIAEYVLEYNIERPHQSLDYQMPIAVFNDREVA